MSPFGGPGSGDSLGAPTSRAYQPLIELTPDRAEAALEGRRRLARWVAAEIVPREAGFRRWLANARLAPDEVDELMQDAYCRVASLDTTDHIVAAEAYFFSVLRSLLVHRLRRRPVVSLLAFSDLETIRDERPSPERVTQGVLDRERLMRFIAALPARCQAVVRLRKIEGWSQKRIADHLDMSEKAVEKQVWLGVKALRQAWSEADYAAVSRLERLGRRNRP